MNHTQNPLKKTNKGGRLNFLNKEKLSVKSNANIMPGLSNYS